MNPEITAPLSALAGTATQPFKLTPARIGRRGVELWLGRWWWACALPLAAMLAASLFDLRWLIAALALALIAYPAILAFAFYSHGLSPATSRLIIPQTVAFSSTSLTITYHNDPPLPPLTIPYAQITAVTDTGASLQIAYTGSWLEIPATALPPQTK